MKQVLFIQGAGAGVYEGWDSRLVESLRRALGVGYEVRYPRMPNEAAPTFAEWRQALDEELAKLASGAAVVGHSVGGAVLVNSLALGPPRVALGAIAIVAAPFIGPGGWESEEIEPYEDLAAQLPPGVPVLIYHGDKDATVPVAHAELYASNLAGAQVHYLVGRDHQLNDDLSEVASDLQRVLAPTPE